MNDKKICCICGKEFSGRGNNPDPVKISGVCCDECNHFTVVPARMKQLVMLYNGITENPAE